MTDALPVTTDYRQLLLAGVPLLDVRAPVEFQAGSIPGAINAPLLDDQERHDVGLTYQQAGQEAAVALGHRLIQGEVRAARLRAWQAFAERHPDGVLYCFRGGMRSQISQRWLHEETGIRLPRVAGGYKALRGFLLEQLDQLPAQLQVRVIGGRTGVGKTLLLQRLPQILDLEALAWHRGSAFGRHVTPQPTQIDFENRLAVALLRHLATPAPRLLAVEDESRNVGTRHVPQTLFDHLQAAPLWILEASLEERVQNTLQEYVVEALAEHQAALGGELGWASWATALTDSLGRIRKRLGGERYREIDHLLRAAIQAQDSDGDLTGHRAWITRLLSDYYDPMYDYQIGRKAERIAFRGTAAEILDAWQREAE